MRSKILWRVVLLSAWTGVTGCKEPAPSSLVSSSPQKASVVRKDEVFDHKGRYVDSFSHQSGMQQKLENGVLSASTIQRRCLVFPFAEKSMEPVTLLAVEDQKTIGMDGEPGVLALHWQTVPSKLSYSGFVYQGRAAHPIRIPTLAAARSADDLDSFRLRFHYKGLSANSTGVTFPIKVRVEPNILDAYPFRLELETMNVNDQWELFEANLGDGSNSKAFLQFIASEAFNGNFKISWNQIGTTEEHNGVTLLIDDLQLGNN